MQAILLFFGWLCIASYIFRHLVSEIYFIEEWFYFHRHLAEDDFTSGRTICFFFIKFPWFLTSLWMWVMENRTRITLIKMNITQILGMHLLSHLHFTFNFPSKTHWVSTYDSPKNDAEQPHCKAKQKKCLHLNLNAWFGLHASKKYNPKLIFENGMWCNTAVSSSYYLSLQQQLQPQLNSTLYFISNWKIKLMMWSCWTLKPAKAKQSQNHHIIAKLLTMQFNNNFVVLLHERRLYFLGCCCLSIDHLLIMLIGLWLFHFHYYYDDDDGMLFRFIIMKM